MQAIVKFVPKHEIVLFSGEKFYIPSEKYESLKKALKTEKFVEVDGSLLNVSSIKTVSSAKSETNLLESLLYGKPDELKRKVRAKVSEREKEWLTDTEGSLLNIIAKFETAPAGV